MHPLPTCVLATGLAATVLACGGDHPVAPAPPKPSVGVHIVSGADVSDTVAALLARPLTIEVRDSSGHLVANTPVKFDALPSQARGLAARPGVFVSTDEAPGYYASVSTSTDLNGRATVHIGLGSVAGPARLEVAALAFAQADTARFAVLPGAASRLAPTSIDTGVVLGSQIQLDVAVLDQFGNGRPDSVAFDPSTAPAVASVSASGVVTSLSVGHTSTTVHAGSRKATLSVEVVPAGLIAAEDNQTGNLVSVRLDGSGLTAIATGGDPRDGPPCWTPSGDIVYSQASRLYRVAPGQSPVLLNSAGTPQATREAWPDCGARSGRITYSAYVQTGSTSEWGLWGRQPDGSVASIPAAPSGQLAWRSTSSPDGDHVAFVGLPSTGYGVRIRSYDMIAGGRSPWEVAGQMPRWSPAGDVIAFVPEGGGPVGLMNADGSHVRDLTSEPFRESPLTWSPDGKWLLGQTSDGVPALVNATTGAVLRLGYLTRYAVPSWHP